MCNAFNKEYVGIWSLDNKERVIMDSSSFEVKIQPYAVVVDENMGCKVHTHYTENGNTDDRVIIGKLNHIENNYYCIWCNIYNKKFMLPLYL